MKSVREAALWSSLLLAPSFVGPQLSVSHSDGTSSGVPHAPFWVATWAASPESADADATEPLLNIENQTVRERVRVSVAGSQIRLCLSNEFGSSPLRLGSVTVALPNGPAGIQPASVHTVTFGGRTSATVPAGAPLLSDPVDFGTLLWGKKQMRS